MKRIPFNNGWQFKEMGNDNFVTVSIPHTPQIEALDVYMNKQGFFEYRNYFKVDHIYPNQRVFLNFEAVMINCKVYVNGTFVKEHFGGYLPFCIDITDLISYNKLNEIFLIVDNHDDPQTPPGKPTKDLDFLYYGGIYRDVEIQIKPQIYLTQPLEQTVAFAGSHIKTLIVDNTARVSVFESIKSFCESDQNGTIIFKIKYNDKIIAQKEEQFLVCANDDTTVSALFEIENPLLWDINNPNLYVFESEIDFGSIKDSRCVNFGIRSVRVTEDGFYLNGEKTELFGLNRGQQYPYIGIAASNEAQRREARMLKESGINCLRLAHYPHSPAFIDECDRLGILVIDPVPGWQFLGDDIWKERLKENLTELVRRDRCHPSVIMYEITPNETNWATNEGDEFLHDLHQIVKREDSYALTSGDTVGRRNSLIAGFDVPYSGNDVVNSPEDTRLKLKREYGDWGFGGNKSSSRCSRGDGEKAMQIQTWNFQFAHNNNLREGGIIGDLIWESIDHNRGYYPEAPISMSGIYDIFRIKKLSYQFVRSQKKSVSKNDYVIFMQALTWNNKKELVFYSNCDKLEIYADGKLIANKTCDNGPDKPFTEDAQKLINDNYWMTQEDHIKTSEKPCYLAMHTKSCLFDAGNCKHMSYPPFTFTNLDLTHANVLTVKGFHASECVKTEEFKTANKAVKLVVKPQLFDIPLKRNDNDFIFVHVSAVDENNTVDTSFKSEITLEVEGGTTIGHSKINAEVGIAGFMIKANVNANDIIITAKCDSLTGSAAI